jgi:hypothetical protein
VLKVDTSLEGFRAHLRSDQEAIKAISVLFMVIYSIDNEGKKFEKNVRGRTWGFGLYIFKFS